MSNDADKVSKGTSLGGCTVQDKLGERAGAVRYRATDESGNDCTVTVYEESCFPSALVRERSLRELRQLMTLEHGSLLRVREVGKTEDGGIFEINDLAPPKSLAQYSDPLDESTVFAVLSAVGDSLLAAQNVGVIHRNLGPGVIFFEGDKPSKQLKVSGFGVAEPHGNGSFGPLATIAPEQVAGKVVDQRSMVYNLAALGHRLLTGKDLYEGTPEKQLKQHLEALLPGGVHERFVRALQKDARRRPMMLKQFLDDLLAKNADTAQAAKSSEGQKPSTRGWTQFMDDDEVEGGSANGNSAPAKPVSAPTSEVKPSTRGWTMFMDSDEAEPEAAPAPEPAPAPVAQENKPKTRGWTMFMDGPDEENKEEGEAAKAEPQAPKKKPEPKKAPAPAAAASDKPKTRGWTMFMDEDPVAAATKEGPAPAAAASSSKVQAPAAASAPSQPPAQLAEPEPSAPAVAASATGTAPADKPAPSTRGWTKFMDDAPAGQEGKEQPVAPEVAPAPSSAAPAAALSQAQARGASQPSANGDGVHVAPSSPESPETPSRPAPSKAPQKSAMEAVNRRVSMGMPKPVDQSQGNAAKESEQSASVQRARTMVMGGNQKQETPPTPAPAPQLELSNPEVPVVGQEAAPAGSSLVGKNPIPESPAPASGNEPSLYRVAAGAGVAGIVLAGIVLLLVYLMG